MNKNRNKSTEEEGSTKPRDRDVYFERSIDFEVPYTRENINECRCPRCPVQADSKCVKDRLGMLKEEMEKMPVGEVPNPEIVPGVYCSTGEAGCKDLNPARQCMCNTCDVWKKYTLGEGKPALYFCKNGRAT